MALETWLIKVKAAISHSFDTHRSTPTTTTPTNNNKKPNSNSNSNSNSHQSPKPKKSNVGVLSFEIATLMSKILHLWESLSDNNVIRIRNESVSLEGVRKIVSNDESFLLGLACAELTENVRLAGQGVSRLSDKCADSSLRSFESSFFEFADSGRDVHGWVLSCKEMEARNKKIDRYVTVTATLYKEIEELSALENSLRKILHSSNDQHDNNHNNSSSSSIKEHKIMDLQQKIICQKQQVKYIKERSLWNRSFDTSVSLLVRSLFTVLSRIKLVFGVSHGWPASLPRTLSTSSSIVHPTDQNHTTNIPSKELTTGFFESNTKLLKHPSSTLGSAGLALHYANLIIVMEKMIKQPQLVGVDARDDLYTMLPNSVRFSLRARLRGVGFVASDPVLAGEWKSALGRILGWLSPVAHNMIKWQSERSFEQQQRLVAKTNVLLLQTLFYANKEKTEAAITELLVGLNYIWRFEREMTAKALFESGNFNGLMLNLQNSS